MLDICGIKNLIKSLDPTLKEQKKCTRVYKTGGVSGGGQVVLWTMRVVER